MMLSRTWLGLGLTVLAAWATVSTVGCGSDAVEGDDASAKGVEHLTTAGQLGGADMAPGTYALTFDDGPGARTEELAHWLGDRGIVGTFFINGKNAPGRDSALAAIKARGHILANHTHEHVDMRTLSGGALYAAIAQTDAVIARYQPDGPWLLRAPFGSWDARVSAEINATDMRKYTGSIFWNVGGELTATTAADWSCWSNGIGVGDCASRYRNEMNARGRGIILLHDSHSSTVDLTKILVESVGAQAFVPLTSAPQIASALGGGGGGGGGGAGAGEGCGDVDYFGRCDFNKLTWCENGVKKTFACETRGKVCSWKNDAEGHDCVVPSPCDGATYYGECQGDMLVWCDATGAFRKVSCAAKGRRCALENEESGYNCLP